MNKKKIDDFDKDFARAQKFIYAWFIFVALLSLALLGGFVFVVYKVLVFFGIM